MSKVVAFEQVSLDGFFVDANGDMSWAHKQDAEWNAFTASNASGNGALVFGRKTYDMMASFWPTPMALQTNPAVAERMNALPKIVFSRTLDAASWNNTTLIKDDIVGAMRSRGCDSASAALSNTAWGFGSGPASTTCRCIRSTVSIAFSSATRPVASITETRPRSNTRTRNPSARRLPSVPIAF